MIDLNSNSVLEAIDFSEVGITDGLVAWYPLNGNTRDYTENRNDATNYGATISSGLNQLCYSFDGVDDYIQAPSKAYLNSYNLTVSCWYYNLPTTIEDLVNKYYSNSVNGWSISKTADGLRLYFFGNGSNYTDTYNTGHGAATIVNNGWNMATFTVSASGAKIYSNGILVGTKLWVGTATNPTTSQPLSIGKYPPSGFFNGLIQDVRIYNRALFPEEIKILYELRKNKKTHFTHDNKVFIPGKFNEVY